MRDIRILAVLLSLCAGAPATAQAPGTRPTVEGGAPKPGSARTAALEFFRGFTGGDAAAVRQRVLAAGEEEQRVVDAMAGTADAVARARQAAAARLGAAEAAKVYFEMMPEHAITTMQEQIDGDRATLLFEGSSAGIIMRRVDGRWRLWLTEMLRATQQTAPKLAKEIGDTAVRVDAVTREIEAGRYKTAEEVGRALAEASVTKRDAEGNRI